MKSAAPSKTSFVVQQLAEEIRSGKFKPGEKLPSMRTLGERFGVSTMVLYQAANQLEEMGLLLRGARSGLFIPKNARQSELCGFITSIAIGCMENYYESFMRVSSEAGCISMTVPLIPDDIECMLEKKPLRIYVDTGCKKISYRELMRLTQGNQTIFCNRFEFLDETPEHAVLSDWEYITEMTLRHFVKNGHKRILFVSHDSCIYEFKRRQLKAAAEKLGLQFDTPEFQWCSHEDFQNNPERVARIFRQDPPTAVFARGDGPLFQFMQKAAVFFPNLPEIEKIGAFNSLWSNQLGHVFSSWQWDWLAFWKQVFAYQGNGIEYYRPKLILK